MEELSSLITRATFSNAYFPHMAAGMCTVVSQIMCTRLCYSSDNEGVINRKQWRCVVGLHSCLEYLQQ